MGGLPKKAHLLETLANEHREPLLKLDAGSLLFNQELLAPNKLDQAKITAEGIAEAYKLMGYQAVGISRFDLAAGLPFLEELRQRFQLNWLSANLVDSKTRKPRFQDRVFLTVGSLKVAVLGITETDANKSLAAADNTTVLPWQDVLPALVADTVQKADLVILLSSCTKHENYEIANTLPGVHLIIQSAKRGSGPVPELKGNTLIAQTGKKGKYQGVMNIHWHPSHKWQISSATSLANERKNLERMLGQINQLENKQKTEDYLDANEGAKRVHDALLDQLPMVREQIATLELQVEKEKKEGAAASVYTSDETALEITMPDQPEVLKIVEEIKKKINLLANKARRQTAATTPYVGWQTCAKCHAPQAASWQKTAHSKAMQSLIQKNQQGNQECIPCHVTGVLTGNEPFIHSLPGNLQQVGCETCHGPGEMHAATPGQWPLTAKVKENICQRCHTPEQDEHFDYAAKVRLIKCAPGKVAKK